MRDEKNDVEKLAAAELFLCENAGPVIKELIERAELTYGVAIRELRVGVEVGGGAVGQSGINCVIVE